MLRKYTPNSIVEIGVSRIRTGVSYEETSTKIMLDEKNDQCIYLGIDLDDKTYLNNEVDNIYTLQSNSINYSTVEQYLDLLEIKIIDFLFIDGWNSINTVMCELYYLKYMKSGSVIGFHDINEHPGPKEVFNVLRTSIFEKVRYSCSKNDYGIGFAILK